MEADKDHPQRVLEGLAAVLPPTTVLLPLPYGSKHPRGDGYQGWQTTTYADTQAEGYQGLLEMVVVRGGNLGVLLGPASGGLATVDIDLDEAVEPFFDLNPPLRDALRTRGRRGCQIWLRMRPGAPYPQKVEPIHTANGEKWGEWRSGGDGGYQSVIYGRHPAAMDYQVLVNRPALEYAFADIVWPEGLVLPWASPTPTPSPARVGVSRLSQFVAEHAEEICARFLPNGRKEGHDWQLANKTGAPGHSLTVTLDGERAGLFYDFGTGEGGDLIALLQSAHGWDFPQVVAELECVYKVPLTRGPLPPLGAPAPAAAANTTNSTPGDAPSGATAATTSTNTTGAYTDDRPPVDWSATNPTNSPGGYEQRAIYPADSVIEDWMQLGIEQTESAEAFILGAILPVIGALMARRVGFPWGLQTKYPNLYVMCAGKPGDRKSSVILPAKHLASRLLPENALLPDNFSPESLFDEYVQRADKLWVVDDAQPILTDWQRMSNGERVAARFLGLYDCGALSETYRRNKAKPSEGARRVIPQTSTSILFGATFGAAVFQGQSIRVGIARRFIYYCATRHGRVIARPAACGDSLRAIREALFNITKYNYIMVFTAAAAALWRDYQHDNRARYQQTDADQEAELSRLSSEPMQTLSIAMIFQAAVCARQGKPLCRIDKPVLALAIEHMAECLQAARFLDAHAERAAVREGAEVLVARVRKDYAAVARHGTILLPRSELTARYAPHLDRKGAWTPDDLFLRFIPALARQGQAKLHEKVGKKEVYAFRVDDE